MPKTASVDTFIATARAWQAEMRALRAILLRSGLDESIKWGKPCFSHGGANVAIIQPVKASCALMFFKGALLTDTHGLLRKQGEHSEAAKRLEFTDVRQIDRAAVTAYVKQAIALQTSGRTTVRPAARALEHPEELTQALTRNRALATAFHALTPGRQRAYLFHFLGAKQPQTRAARIEKCAPQILDGKGLNDR